jgi:predicted metalloprotease with PDZ domain
LVKVVSAVGGKDYGPFFDRYVRGTEPPPFEQALALAGFRMEQSVSSKPALVFEGGVTPQGELKIMRVAHNSAAEQAGLAVGDVIESVEGEALPSGYSKLAPKLEGRIGNTVRAAIKRGGQVVNLDLKVEAREVTLFRMAELERPTAAQMKVRNGWLTNAPERGRTALTARLGGGSAPPARQQRNR